MSLQLPQNYFDLFDLPCASSVDEEELTRRYRDLQRDLHPDRYVNGSDRERRLAAAAAAHVNRGYYTLKDQYDRAAYLLELQDISLDDERDTTEDMEFLMRQMELREAMEELSTLDEVQNFDVRLDEDAGALWSEFVQQYDSENWLQAREALLKLRFYRRLKQKVQEIQIRLPRD